MSLHCPIGHQRSEENSKLSALQDSEETEWRHSVASFGYYMTMQHNRAERKRLHNYSERSETFSTKNTLPLFNR